MTNLSQFCDLFTSEVFFEEASFPKEVLTGLKNYLDNENKFKQKRILHLLDTKQYKADEERLELFKWYYQQVDFHQLPRWFENKLTKFTADNENIRVMSYPDLLSNFWTINDIVKSSIMLSDDGIDSYYANELEVLHWVRLREKNLSLFSGALCAGELIGQVGFIMLDEDENIKLQKGELAESDIQGVALEYSGPITLYIPSVVIKREYQHRYILPMMFNHLFEQLISLPDVLRRLQGFVALAYSQAGRDLCEGFNMQLQSQNKSADFIYTGCANSFTNSALAKKLKLPEFNS